jgi:hypothetical protein
MESELQDTFPTRLHRLPDGCTGFRMPAGARDLHVSKPPPPSFKVPRILLNLHRGSLPRIKRPWRQVHHLPPPCAEAEWSYTSTPHTPSWCGQRKLCLYFHEAPNIANGSLVLDKPCYFRITIRPRVQRLPKLCCGAPVCGSRLTAPRHHCAT